jgi:hypothetical protein
MVRRKWLWGAVLLGVVLLGGVACLLLAAPPDRITERNCNKIVPGMTAAQVEDILGRKPDAIVTVGGVELQRTWIGRTGSIDVAFDDDGRVVSRMPFMRMREESVLERLRSWLPW